MLKLPLRYHDLCHCYISSSWNNRHLVNVTFPTLLLSVFMIHYVWLPVRSNICSKNIYREKLIIFVLNSSIKYHYIHNFFPYFFFEYGSLLNNTQIYLLCWSLELFLPDSFLGNAYLLGRRPEWTDSSSKDRILRDIILTDRWSLHGQ